MSTDCSSTGKTPTRKRYTGRTSTGKIFTCKITTDWSATGKVSPGRRSTDNISKSGGGIPIYSLVLHSTCFWATLLSTLELGMDVELDWWGLFRTLGAMPNFLRLSASF